MATRGLGTLTLDLLVKVGGFKQGMSEAERAAERAMRAISDGAKRASTSVQQSFSTTFDATKIGQFATLAVDHLKKVSVAGAGLAKSNEVIATSVAGIGPRFLALQGPITKATADLKRLQEEAKKTSQLLQAGFGDRLAAQVATPYELYRKQVELFNFALEKGVITQQTFSRALHQTTQAFVAGTPAMQRWNALVEEGKRLMAANVGPQEAFRNRFKELTQLALSGQITPEVRTAEIAKEKAIRDQLTGVTAEQNRLDAEAARIKQSQITPQREYNEALVATHKLLLAQKITQTEFNTEAARLRAVLDASNPALQSFNKLMAEGAQMAARMSTPLEALQARIQKIKEISAAARAGGVGVGGLSADEFEARGLQEAEDAYRALNPAVQENIRLEKEAAAIKSANTTAQERYDAAIAHSAALIGKVGFTQADHNREMARQRAILDASNPALQEHARLMADGARATQAHMTAQERFDAELARAKALLNTYDATLNKTAIDMQTYQRMVAAARLELDRATQSQKKMTSGLIDFGRLVGRGFGLQALAAQALSIYALIRGFQTLIKTADDLALMSNRLSLVTKGADDLKDTQQALFEVSQRTRTEFLATADLYVRLAQAGGELGASQGQLLKFTEAVGNALTISGTSAERARGVLIQLSQGLATGTFRAEEFNSVLEGAPVLIRTVAQNIDRFKGSVGALRNAVREGKLQSTEFFDAALKGSDDLARAMQEMPVTISQAFTQLKNVFAGAVLQADIGPLTKSVEQLKDLFTDPQFKQDITAFVELIFRLAGLALQAAAGIGRIFEASITNFKIITGQLSEYERLQVAIDRRRQTIASESWMERDLAFIGLTNEQLKDQIGYLEKRKKLAEGGALAPLGSVARTRAISRAPAEERIERIDIESQKEAENAQKSILKQIEALNQQRAVLNKNAAATIAYRIAQGDLKEEFEKAGPTFDQYKRVLINAAAALEQATAVQSVEKAIESLQRQAAVLNLTEREAFEYNLTQGELAEQLEKTGAAQAGLTDEYRRAWVELQKQKDTKTIIDGMVEVQQRLLELQGKTAEAAKLATRDRYKDLTDAIKRQIAGETSRPIPIKAEASQAVTVLDDIKQRMIDLAKGVEIPIKAQTAAGVKKAAEFSIPLNIEFPKNFDALGREIENTVVQAKRLKEELATPVKVDTSQMREVVDKTREVSKGLAIKIPVVYTDPAGFPIDLSRPRLPVPGTQDVMTEFTITEEIEGRWYNLPRIVRGVLVDVETAVADARARIAASDPFTIPNFATLEEALKNAPLRSEAISAAIQSQTADVDALAAGYSNLGEKVEGLTDAQLREALASIQATIELESFLAEADALNKKIDDIRSKFGRQEQTIQTRAAVGNRSQIGLNRELLELHQREADALQELYEQYQRLGNISGLEEIKRQAEELRLEIEQLRLSVETLGQTMADAFEEGLGGALGDVAKGVESLGDAAESFLQSLTDSLIDWASEQVAAQMRDIIFGPEGPLGDILKMIEGGGIFKTGGLGGLFGDGLEEIAVTAQRLPEGVGQVAAAGAQTAATAGAITAAGTAAGAAITGATAGLAAAGTTFATAISTAGTAVATAIGTAGTAAAAAIRAAAVAGGSGAGLETLIEGFDFSGIGFAKGGPLSLAVAAGQGMARYAGGGPLDVFSGGFLRGPGTPTSDSLLLRGSKDEFMVQAKAVAQPGGRAFLDAYNAGLITMQDIRLGLEAIGRAPRFAGGGSLSQTPATVTNTSMVSNRSGNTIIQHLHITAPGGQVSRQTELQLTAAAARGARSADRRNN